MSGLIETTGTIKRITRGEAFNGKPKANLWLEHGDNPEWLQVSDFEFYDKSAANVDGFNEGDKVTVVWRLRGREYERKDGSGAAIFNTLSGWKVKAQESTQAAPADDDVPF